MTKTKDQQVIETTRRAAHPLTGGATDYDPLMKAIGEKRFVLLGEASHGTHDFYSERAEITKRLILEKGFNVVAIEADFPDANRVNRFVRATSEDRDADAALSNFRRFPSWMWRNLDVLNFVRWLREHNDYRSSLNEKVSFYGLDLYSLHASVEAVIEYLERVDPEAARRARARYTCFAHFEDSQAYGYAASTGEIDPCEQGAVEQLIELQRRARELADRDGRQAADDFFTAEQNARLVQNAEEYYRSMFRGGVSSWNLRDRHMVETLEAIVQYGDYLGEQSKIVVWAHNSHLGDASRTDMGERGEWNVGQLARERFGPDDTMLVGWTTYTGTVTAASNWGDEPEYKLVCPALDGSYEQLFHQAGRDRFLLNFADDEALTTALSEPRLERAIGVIYRPETERWSHYFYASIAAQFDAVIHFDVTRAVHPLEPSPVWSRAYREGATEAPDTYPSGM